MYCVVCESTIFVTSRIEFLPLEHWKPRVLEAQTFRSSSFHHIPSTPIFLFLNKWIDANKHPFPRSSFCFFSFLSLSLFMISLPFLSLFLRIPIFRFSATIPVSKSTEGAQFPARGIVNSILRPVAFSLSKCAE